MMKPILRDKAHVFLPNILILYRHISSSFFSYLLTGDTGWQAAQNKTKIMFVKCVRILKSAKYYESVNPSIKWLTAS